MRISKIKLAGFKSFVDPTTLTLPVNLTGVVGPNGCGKSNIIDALQWVMGESSAKQLRGDSMADVIFNGSNSRKPVGQASVELVFDNSDGTLGGQYAGYGEISIKRSLTRDGVSTYQLNGTRCRRKDVTNVFLGTGLGARGGYSVIEQGMISRVVEAKPEELRGFLEEAAGISKYKERRRETETRIRHTKENIERLDDIREEITKQLAHLQRQARAAERYQTLKTEERLTDAQLLALRWREIDRARTEQAQTIGEIQTRMEAATAELRNIETQQTQKRDEQTQATDNFNRVQSEFYAKSAEISRLEQALQHAEERKTSLENDLTRSRKALEEMNELLHNDAAAIADIVRQLTELEPAAAEHEQTAEQANAALQEAEAKAQAWQAEWDTFNRERGEVSREEHAEQMRIEHLREGISGARERLEGLESEQRGLSTLTLEAEINTLRNALMAAEKRHDEQLVRRDEIKSSVAEARQQTFRYGDELHELRTILATLKGREASLAALQDAALRENQGELQAWLAEIGLGDPDLLAEQIEIERGWESAVEMAMKVPLGAVCANGSVERALTANRSTMPTALATFVDEEATGNAAADGSLAAKVRSKWPLASLLAGVYTADSIDEARQRAGSLAAHESVITRDGYWLGPGWVQINGGAEAEPGILARESALEELRRDIAKNASRIEAAQSALEEAQQAVADCEAREADVDVALATTAQETTVLKTDLARLDTTLDRQRERAETIRHEISALQEKFTGGEAAAATALSTLEAIRARLAQFDLRHDTLVANRDAVQQALDAARGTWRDAREARHATALKLEGLRSSRESLQLALSRNERQQHELAGRCTDLETAMASTLEPQEDLKTQLERALAERVDSEKALGAAREVLENLEAEIKGNDEARLGAERAVEAQREILDQARLEERAVQVRQQEVEQRLKQTEYTAAELLEALEPGADEATWAERLEKVRRRIERLGPINLAAIDEFSQLSERKEYLDSQHKDLSEALDTLEGAIRKIDRETRTRFKETFDKVNSGMQKMFPILFGGGHAYLELTGEDLLETGVTVMARPPGKRNSTIHLLSGGEKALTALSFVFSLFELNPAPFCLLDEVDAPLDDANVVRLSKMLKTMSQTVQFICVTHNKITMEISEQLVGVTMHEAGVSRLVSVNMDEAVEMAAAS